eukprot:gene34-biopygen7325
MPLWVLYQQWIRGSPTVSVGGSVTSAVLVRGGTARHVQVDTHMCLMEKYAEESARPAARCGAEMPAVLFGGVSESLGSACLASHPLDASSATKEAYYY